MACTRPPVEGVSCEVAASGPEARSLGLAPRRSLATRRTLGDEARKSQIRFNVARTTSTFPQVRGDLRASRTASPRVSASVATAGQPQRLHDLRRAVRSSIRVDATAPRRRARAAAIGPGRRHRRRGRAPPARRGRSGSRRRRTPAPRPRPPRRRRGGHDAVVAARSSWRPPWLDTHTAAAPASTHRRASSGRSTPLTTTGRPVVSASQARSDSAEVRGLVGTRRRRRTPARSSPGGSPGRRRPR